MFQVFSFQIVDVIKEIGNKFVLCSGLKVTYYTPFQEEEVKMFFKSYDHRNIANYEDIF